jgi:competence protein ComEC
VWGQLFVDEVVALTPGPDPRARFVRGVVRGLAERPAALMQAMTLGVRDDLGELRSVFAEAGLAHVLALSGLHVGVLMAALGRLLAGLGLRRYPLMLALLIGFVLLVGATPSVVRAATMVAALLLALWLGVGRIQPWPLLALAALVGLLWNPAWLFDLSFQLSYLAVAGMLLVGGPLLARFGGAAPRPWWHWRTLLLAAIVTSAAAQALSLPLVAHAFGRLPLLSPLINVVAVPLAALLVPLGFAAALLGLVALPLAGALNALVAPLASLLIALAELGAGWPSLPWGEVAPIGFLYFGVAAAALALALHGRLRPDRALLLLASALVASWLQAPPSPAAELIFLDVGQGDSALIRLPGRVEILVDGGGTPFGDYDVGAGTVVPALRALGVDELELVIASHADADHIEGLVAVLEALPVQVLALGHPAWDKGVFQALMAVAERRGVPVWRLRRGETLRLGGASLDILNPPERPYPEVNDNSVAFALRWGGRSRALFLGDLGAAVEAELAAPEAEVLMVPHHGSTTSTSAALLAAVRPEVAVISVGRNRFGHPAPEVLARLRAAGVRIHTTLESGAVRLPLGAR